MVLKTVTTLAPDLHFQWLRDGLEIPNATGASLEVAITPTTQGGCFQLEMAGPSGITHERAFRLQGVSNSGFRLSTPTIRGRDHPEFSVQGLPGTRVILESSPDLVTWGQVRETRLQGEEIRIQSLAPLGSSPRFYRARTVPPN